MQYLRAKDILFVHSAVIDETGGTHGVRDTHAILGLEDLPKQTAFGKELYPSIHIKAALYVRNIIFSHPFIDGNKRTAITSAFVFLADNGYSATCKKGEIEIFAVDVVVKKMSLEQIAGWLKDHSKKVARKK